MSEEKVNVMVVAVQESGNIALVKGVAPVNDGLVRVNNTILGKDAYGKVLLVSDDLFKPILQIIGEDADVMEKEIRAKTAELGASYAKPLETLQGLQRQLAGLQFENENKGE